jgi:hypothetical protein
MMKPKSIVAVIYPLLPKHLDRIFDGKDIFCKYQGRGKCRLEIGNRLMFYASGRHEITGQGEITNIESLKPDKLISKYRDRLFITKEELEDYRGTRSSDRELLVLTLSNIRRLDTPLKPLKPITMSGWTLSQSEYDAQLSSRIISIASQS